MQIHCLSLTKPKIVLCDAKDAQVLGPVAETLKSKNVGPIFSWHDLSHLPAHTYKGVTVSEEQRVVADISRSTSAN